MMLVESAQGRAELCAMLAGRGVTCGAEIGIWAGEFSEMLCQLIPGVNLTCVDPWMAYHGYVDGKNDQVRLDAAYASTRARLLSFHCNILRMDSIAASKTIPDGSLDFVYIDGNHGETFVRSDLEAWSPKVRSCGIVAGHDYEIVQKHDHVQVKAAVDAFVLQHQISEFYVLTKNKAPSFYWVKP